MKKIYIPNSNGRPTLGLTITEKKEWSKDELLSELELIYKKTSNLSLSQRKWIVDSVRTLIRENKLSAEEITKLEEL